MGCGEKFNRLSQSCSENVGIYNIYQEVEDDRKNFR